MAILAITVPDDFMNKLTEATKSTPAAVVRDAITLFNWAVQEGANERAIYSCTPDGQDMQRLNMQSLNQAFSLAVARKTYQTQMNALNQRTPKRKP